MALLRTKEIRAMDEAGREKKLRELRDELMHERGVAAMGGAPPNPGKIRALRKNIARLRTIESEQVRSGRAPGSAPAPAAPQKEPEAEPEDELDVEDESDEEPEEDTK